MKIKKTHRFQKMKHVEKIHDLIYIKIVDKNEDSIKSEAFDL